MKVKSQKPFFSIIIPALNEELFLPNLLTSLSKQNFKDFEVIIVDGHSEDKTVKVVKSFNKKLQKLTILNSLKRHVSAQRNLGAKKAKGKYLIFFDADSDINACFLAKLHKVLKKNSLDLFSSKIKNTSDLFDNALLFLGNTVRKYSGIINQPVYGGGFIGCKKSVFLTTGGFKTNLNLAEDHDFTCRCAKKGLQHKLLDNPQYYFSFRRFKHEGYLKVLRKWTIASLCFLKKTPSPSKLNYEMGGTIYQRSKTT